MDRRGPNRVRGLPAAHLLPADAQGDGMALAMLANDHSGAAVVARGGTARVQYLLCVEVQGIESGNRDRWRSNPLHMMVRGKTGEQRLDTQTKSRMHTCA